MKNFSKILFVFLGFMICNNMSGMNNNKSTDIMFNMSKKLTEEELTQFSISSLYGELKYDNQLCLYYDLYLFDADEAAYWYMVGYENGDLTAAYTLGQYYSYSNKYRAFYLLKLCAENGIEDAKIVLKEEKLNFSQIDSNNYNSMVTSENIQFFKEGAYLGSKKAAIKLAEYYKTNNSEYVLSNTIERCIDEYSYIYWLRIGAQNGNQECIKQYYELLKTSKNEYDNIRAQFWERKIEK